MLAFIAAAASAETPCEGIPAGVACALPNSQSVTADLTIGEVKTYKLVLGVNAGAPDIQLVLTRLSGNPDLFASFTEPVPTNSAVGASCVAPSCWSSTDAEGDVILIPHTDPKLIECVHGASESAPCTLHMAVKGVEASRFSLLPSAIKVGSGFHVEAPDALAGQDYEFAASAFGAPLPLRPLTADVVYAQPGNACPPSGAADNWQLSNAAQVFGAIALIDRGVGPSNDCPYPGRYFASKVLQAQHAGAVAVIVANDHVEPEPCGGGRTSRCQLVAMGTSDGDLAETVSIPSVFVSKATGDALKAAGVRVTLQQPASTLQLLELGYPTNGVADANSWQYYALWTGFSKAEISITVSAKFGNPDLYVSSDGGLPNPTSGYTWRSTNAGSDTLVLTADDPDQHVNTRYIVGVFANGASTAYTLTVAMASDAIALQSNVPLPAQTVEEGAYKYYTAWVDSDADAITVAVTVLQGDADLYVSTTQPKPTVIAHTWRAVGKAGCQTVDCGNTIMNGDAVSIRGDDPNYCQGLGECTLHIGVYGAQQSTFTALVTTSDAGADTPVMLLDAQPIDRTIAQAGHYAYFNFEVPSDAKHVVFAIGASSDDDDGVIDGDPDLYVDWVKVPSLSPQPSGPDRKKFVYHSSGDGNEALTVTMADSSACQPEPTRTCVYRLAVYAWRSPTRFSISATIKRPRFSEDGADGAAPGATSKPLPGDSAAAKAAKAAAAAAAAANPLKAIDANPTVLQAGVKSPVTLAEDEAEMLFRFTVFEKDKHRPYEIKFVPKQGSATPQLRWMLKSAPVEKGAKPAGGGPPPPPPAPAPQWHDFDYTTVTTLHLTDAGFFQGSRDVYVWLARGEAQAKAGAGAITGSLRFGLVVGGGGRKGGGAGGTVVLVLFLLLLFGGGGLYAYLVYHGKRDLHADAAALKELAAAAARRVRAAAAAATGAASGRGRVGDAATNHHMVAPLASSSYAPPDEVPALQRLPDNLPPLGADGTAGGAGEKPNAGLLTSAAV